MLYPRYAGRIVATVDAKTRILEAAAALLSSATEADISTRAVCEQAGVSAPALYRHFGDKEGLLSAVVDFGFEQYLASKRALAPGPDPVQDVRDGWDNHVSFAVNNPNYYTLMYSPVLTVPPAAAREAHELLLQVLGRVAEAGLLKVPVELAGQMVMSANAGVALSLITRRALYPDPTFSAGVREAVLAAVLHSRPDADPTHGSTGRHTERLASTATTMRALLAKEPVAALTGPEAALLDQWLVRLARPDA